MSKFKTAVDFFNSFESGQFVTRKMYMDVIGEEISETSADYYRCLLQRAGYLYDFKRDEVLYGRGIYYVSKTIPNISYRQVRREAYE